VECILARPPELWIEAGKSGTEFRRDWGGMMGWIGEGTANARTRREGRQPDTVSVVAVVLVPGRIRLMAHARRPGYRGE
jgi:hypothetical protein